MNSLFRNNIPGSLFSQNTAVSILRLEQKSLNTISSELEQDIIMPQINTFKNQFIDNDFQANVNNPKFQQLLQDIMSSIQAQLDRLQKWDQ